MLGITNNYGFLAEKNPQAPVNDDEKKKVDEKPRNHFSHFVDVIARTICSVTVASLYNDGIVFWQEEKLGVAK